MYMNIDANNDNEIQVSEALAVSQITIAANYMPVATGIASLQELKHLQISLT
jgi:hypothetical protein